MKILILANEDDGLYRFRHELIEALLKEHEVHVALPYGPMVDNLVSLGCGFTDTPMERRGMNPARDLELYKLYKKILREVRPDFVITYTIKPNIYGGYACRKAGIPYAVNITGLGTAFEGRLKPLVTGMYRAALKKVRVVFFENTENRDLFVREKIIDAGRCCALKGAGVNTERFSCVPYPRNDVFRFLFIARIMKEKGIDELMEAMKRLTAEGIPCELDVLGPYEEDYEGIFQPLQEAGWLKYHGAVPDVRPWITECDCFVLPSYHEGMANTNLECASCGRPLITSDIPGCREAVLPGVSGLLCQPKDADSLYDAMKKMTQCPREERERMGLAGRKHIEDVFDKRKVVARTLEAMGL